MVSFRGPSSLPAWVSTGARSKFWLRSCPTRASSRDDPGDERASRPPFARRRTAYRHRVRAGGEYRGRHGHRRRRRSGRRINARAEYRLPGPGVAYEAVVERLATEFCQLQAAVGPSAWLAGVGVGVPAPSVELTDSSSSHRTSAGGGSRSQNCSPSGWVCPCSPPSATTAISERWPNMCAAQAAASPTSSTSPARLASAAASSSRGAS